MRTKEDNEEVNNMNITFGKMGSTGPKFLLIHFNVKSMFMSNFDKLNSLIRRSKLLVSIPNYFLNFNSLLPAMYN